MTSAGESILKLQKLHTIFLNTFKYIQSICSLWLLFINRTLNEENLHVSKQLSLPNSKCSNFKHHFEVCASLLSTTDSLVLAASSHFRCGLLHVSLQRYKAWAGIRKMFDRSEYRWKKKLQNHVSAAICWCKSDLGYSIKLSDHSTLTCVWLHGYFNMAMGNPAVLHSLMLALP